MAQNYNIVKFRECLIQKGYVLLSWATLSAISHKVSQLKTFSLLGEGRMGSFGGSHCPQVLEFL
jgi:hypothetical protein